MRLRARPGEGVGPDAIGKFTGVVVVAGGNLVPVPEPWP